MNLDGSDFWLSGWNKVSNENEKYVSIAGNGKNDNEIKLSGRLNTNFNKSKDNHPDMIGHVSYNGIKTEIAGWFHKRPKSKEKYISISVSTSGGFDERVKEMPWDF
jgi:uncharacterized protein (DUF736 family)